MAWDIVLTTVRSAIALSTPLVLATLGAMLPARAGVLNIGIEGLMLGGALSAFAVTLLTRSPWLGLLAAIISGLALSAIHGLVVIRGIRIRSRWLAMAAVIAVGSLAFLLVGHHPFRTWWVFLSNTFGSWLSLSEVLVKASMLSLTGLAFLLPMRAGLWNIGAEGQMLMGATAAYGLVMIAGTALGPLTLPAMFVAGALGAMLWGLIPAMSRTVQRAPWAEIVATIMMNTVALLVVRELVHNVWRAPGHGFPRAVALPSAAQLGRLGTTDLHLGLVVTAALVAVAAVFLARTVKGFRIRLAGEGEGLLKYSGLSVSYVLTGAFLVGAAAAGIAGVHELSGGLPRLRDTLGVGLGLLGIPVALLSGGSVVRLPLAALAMAVVYVGTQHLRFAGVPYGLESLLTAAIVLAYLAWRPRREPRYQGYDIKVMLLSGLAIWWAGTGLTHLLGSGLVGQSVRGFMPIVRLGNIGWMPAWMGTLVRSLMEHTLLVPLALAAVVLMSLILTRHVWGLRLRYVGDNPLGAESSGVNAKRVQWACVLSGGVLAATGGAAITLSGMGSWQLGITAGQGWIAVGLMVLAGASPWRGMVGALVFGGILAIIPRAQILGLALSTHIIGMLPYVAIVILPFLLRFRIRSSRRLLLHRDKEGG